MQKSTFSAQARTQNRTDKTTKEENDKQPTETPKTHTHTLTIDIKTNELTETKQFLC